MNISATELSHRLPYLSSLKPVFEVDTTSFDGRPLLTPSEFRNLFQRDISMINFEMNNQYREDTYIQTKKLYKLREHLKKSIRAEKLKSNDKRQSNQTVKIEEFEEIRKKVKIEEQISHISTQEESVNETDTFSTMLCNMRNNLEGIKNFSEFKINTRVY